MDGRTNKDCIDDHLMAHAIYVNSLYCVLYSNMFASSISSYLSGVDVGWFGLVVIMEIRLRWN